MENTKKIKRTSASGTPRKVKKHSEYFQWHPDEKKRKTFFPILHLDINQLADLMERNNWTADEVDVSKDKNDWIRMNEEDKRPVRYSLGVFANLDNVVLAGLPNLIKKVKCMEARRAYTIQEYQETVHVISYMLQIDTISTDDNERDFMLNSIVTMPAVRALIKWCRRWINKDLPFEMAFFALGWIEGVAFQGFFCILQWLREKNLLPGVTTFNEGIMRDEGCHTHLYILLKNRMINQISEKAARRITKSGIRMISKLIHEALPKPRDVISAESVMTYIKFQANVYMSAMGYHSVYDVKNPFKWMDKFSLNKIMKVNFFDKRHIQYQEGGKDCMVFEIDKSRINY